MDAARPPARPAGALPALERLVAADMARVDGLMTALIRNEVPMIPELAGHIGSAGGKRLRPMLTLAAARLCGCHGSRHITLAACVELFHTATLLHDDVVDESELRRGVETANVLWGNRASVLVGDFLLGRAFQAMVEAGSREALALFAKVAAELAEGELRQLSTVGRVDTGVSQYMEVIEGKTAALFGAACRLGAMAADAPGSDGTTLEIYGRNLGAAFQLADDVLDWSGRQAELGKAVGDDFNGGKVTVPVILAFGRGDSQERVFWRRTLEEGVREPGDFERALALLRRRQALADTLAFARDRAEEARRALDRFPDNPVRAALLGLAAFCVERRH